MVAACAALALSGLAQAATVVAGATATVLAQVVAEPVIVLSASGYAPTSNTVTLTASNVAARSNGASLSGNVSLGDSAPVVAMQAGDARNPGAKPADGQAGMLGDARKLAVDLSQAELAALSSVSVTLNYN
jgi:hypothetical protein